MPQADDRQQRTRSGPSGAFSVKDHYGPFSSAAKTLQSRKRLYSCIHTNRSPIETRGRTDVNGQIGLDRIYIEKLLGLLMVQFAMAGIEVGTTRSDPASSQRKLESGLESGENERIDIWA
jgi:hypothetical protein